MDEAVHDTIERLNRQCLRMADHLSALRELADLHQLAHSDLSGLLQEALGILLLRGSGEAASVFLREGGHLHCHAGLSREDLISGTGRGDPEPYRFRLDEGVAGLTVATGRMQHCRDTRHEPRYLPLPGRAIGSLICLPLHDRQEVLGVLHVSHPRRNAFDEAHERLFSACSACLAQLIAHWRLRHRLEALAAQRAGAPEQILRRLEADRLHDRTSLLDPVTGLYNERFLLPELRRLGARAARAGDSLALLLVALRVAVEDDRPLGDGVRRRLWALAAGLLRTLIREGDVLCHLGGGCFALCLPGGDQAAARRLADRIREDLGSLRYRADGTMLRVDALTGAADASPQPAGDGWSRLDADRLLAAARERLSAADAEFAEDREKGLDWCRKSDSN